MSTLHIYCTIRCGPDDYKLNTVQAYAIMFYVNCEVTLLKGQGQKIFDLRIVDQIVPYTSQ